MARSTFKVLFYVNGSKEKEGIVPIMGRVTINGTVAQFSCKRTIPKELWDVKGNRAKGKSREAIATNLSLDNIKAQIIKHYQRLSDREAFVTAEMVRNAYQGLGSEYDTLLKAFDRDCASLLKRVGKDRSMGTYKVMLRARNNTARFIRHKYNRSDMSMLELTPRLHQGLRRVPQHGERKQERHDMDKLHVAQRRGDACALQRQDTEKPVRSVPCQPEHEGACVPHGGRVEDTDVV